MWSFISSLALIAAVQGRAAHEEQAKEFEIMNEAMMRHGSDYTWEAHEVKTNDGYILTMFRIVGDQNGEQIPYQGSKGPLLLQHGFLTDSISWFHFSDESKPALPVRLFQEGFDVWLGNNRGTMNSRGHVKLDPDVDHSFWDFSHHHFAAFDIP